MARPHPAELIERSPALARLDDALHATRGGRGRVVLIEGEAGVGKTRLLAELRGRATSAGTLVLTARGTELEREFGFGVAGALLGPAVRGDDGRIAASVPAPVRGLLGLDGGVGAAVDLSRVLLDGFFRVVEALAERPLVLSVDDAQWADDASARTLAYIANRIEQLPVLLAVGRRDTEPGPSIRAIAALPHADRIALQALSPRGTARMAQGHGATGLSAEDGAALHTLTRGVPLLVATVAADVAREGTAGLGAPRALTPSALNGLVLSRLLEVSPGANAVAKAVAVLGDGAPAPQVAALAGVDPPVAVAASAELERVGLFGVEDPMTFAHPLLAQAVRGDEGANERARSHLRAAVVLRDAGAPAAQIAEHLVRGPGVGDRRAVDDLRAAAAVARSRAAPETAVRYLERALAEPPPAADHDAVRTELGLAHHARGDVAAAWEQLAFTVEDPAADLDVVLAAGQARLLSGSIPQGVDTLIAAAGIRSGTPDDVLRLSAVAGYYDWWNPEPDRRRPALPEVAGPPGSTPGDRLACIARMVYSGLGPGTHHAEPVRFALAALGDGALARDSAMTLVYANSPILLLLYAERLGDAGRELDHVRATEHREGWPGSRLTAEFPRIHLLLLRGETAAAVAEGRRLLELTSTVSGPLRATLEGMATGFVLLALLEHDGPDAADALLAERDLDGDLGPEWFLLLGPRSLVHLAAGRADAALADAQGWRAVMIALGDPVQPVELQAAEPLALAAVGRQDEARACAAAELQRARDWGVPGRIASQLRLAARLVPERAEDLLIEAAGLVDGSPLLLERARVLLDLGRAQRRAGRRGEARATLEQAVQRAAEAQAHVLAEAGIAELHVLGARPRRRAFSGVDALTASERRVADLAVQGRTTKQIAEHLFVTTKTVESHLGKTYRKLGIASRGDLASALAGDAAPTVGDAPPQ